MAVLLGSAANGAVNNSGKILVAGGYDPTNTNALASIELFDPTANSGIGAFTLAAESMWLQTPRYGHTATLLYNGKVLMAGGYSSVSATELATAELFDWRLAVRKGS